MALSAADLQRKHELEGTPDPFPSLVGSPVKPRIQAPVTQVDTNFQTAFPSLAPAAAPVASAPKSAWGADAGPRIKPSVARQPVFTDTFTLAAIELTASGRDQRPPTLGEVMKQVMTKYKVKLDASRNERTRQTTFHVKADTQKELDKAKRSLLALLSPVITHVIQAPASTIASIIGPKGATLKQIRDQTSVRVDIPRRDTLALPNGGGHVNGNSSGKATPSQDDEEEELLVPVTLVGPQPLVYEAEALLKQIISSKTSKTTQRVRDIPVNILPFVTAQKAQFEAAAQGEEIRLTLNTVDREITVSGDREAVGRVVETIRASIDTFKASLTSLKISLPKRQHRLLSGAAAQEVLVKSKCAVIVAKPDEPSDEITVWGYPNDLAGGLTAVMEQANSKYIHEFPLPGPIATSRQLLTYMTRINYPKTLMTANPDVSVFTPSLAVIDKAQSLTIDLVGDKSAVDVVVRQVSELIGKLIGATLEVNIDWLVHRIVMGKNAKKIKQFHDVHNVSVYFPGEAMEQSSVLLVYDPLSPSASPSPDEKRKHLDDVSKELLKMAKDAADVKGEVVSVAKRWHDSVVGQGGTTLNAIIGEDKTLSIKVGADAADPSGEDVIVIRGASADVDRAVKEILKIVEDAKNDEIVNSYSTEFDIEREFVGRIVGAQGSGVNKLRDQLGVKVDVSDDDEKDKEGSKKKKGTHHKSKVTITGRKENVEEAKKRILTQLERIADETSEVLKIPSQYHSSLIGQSGKYAIRLEEKYSVKITFPRQNAENGEAKTREQLKSDEVLVKGGKKGVACAKAELLEALEFERESNNILKFTVPTRSVARILGRGGASINEIKDNTDAQIDVDKASDDSSVTNITVRGTKKAVAAAKAAILVIADQIAEECNATVVVESRFHRTLIGSGGQGLKELVARCGGPSDPKVLAGLIRFPRQGEPSDEVRLRGEQKLVNKVKAELEKAVAALRDRVVLAVGIPAGQHRALIGRGGQNLNEMQDRHNVQIQFPGSRSYGQFGEPENASEFADADSGNLVKVSGSRAACEKAVEELKTLVKPAVPEGVTDTVNVPLKYHHVISQQGHFFRTLRTLGVQVDQSVQPQQSAVPSRPEPADADAASARIDADAEAEAPSDAIWEVVPNYQNVEEGDSTWTLKARDQAALDKARQLITDAVNAAAQMTSVGFLTLSDRTMFPRIVGSKGSNVARLRNETGADITVSRENSTIVIMGSETDIVAAKDAILKMSSTPTGRSQRRHS
ncbi:hypothetical protein EDD85DRAFT_994234 [Armillaria nabsnona]|nr:hypothetical protein EDD85DRAFT_994234 [Armillaria nabsnona]